MRKIIGCVAAMACVMGIAGEVGAAENNSSQALLVRQANQAQAGDVTTTRAIGICKPSPNQNFSAENGLAPVTSARGYFKLYEHRTVTGTPITTVLQQPAHGVLRLVTEADRGTLFDRESGPLSPTAGLYAYLPEPGYVGKDSATILVDFGGVKVQVKYYFQATDVVSNDWMEDYCKTGPFWKISSSQDANGNLDQRTSGSKLLGLAFCPARGAALIKGPCSNNSLKQFARLMPC